jgi:hypothetical protein
MERPSEPTASLLERLAGALAGAPVPEGRERALLLRLARDVAHAGERQDAPLTTYLIGRFVEMRRAAGVPESKALEEADAAVRAVAADRAGDE